MKSSVFKSKEFQKTFDLALALAEEISTKEKLKDLIKFANLDVPFNLSSCFHR